MRVWAYTLRPRSAFRLLPSASTLWGQLAWAIRELEGDAALTDWLDAHHEAIASGKEPPLRLSSAFPKGFLPRPHLRPVLVEETTLRKRLKGVRWVSPELFARMLEKGEEALRSAVEAKEPSFLSESPFERAPRTRVAMNRLTGAAAEGQLFEDHVYWPKTELVVYAKLNAGVDPSYIAHLLSHVGQVGFGGGASIGLGAFDLAGPEETELPAVGKGAKVLLGPALLPKEAKGYWRGEFYWGRLGHVYAHAPVPFKRPYLRVLEGATLPEDAPDALLDVTPPTPPASGVQIFENLAPLFLPAPKGVI